MSVCFLLHAITQTQHLYFVTVTGATKEASVKFRRPKPYRESPPGCPASRICICTWEGRSPEAPELLSALQVRVRTLWWWAAGNPVPSRTAGAQRWLLLDVPSACCHERTGVTLRAPVELRFSGQCSPSS